jgi:hypothetical protein
MDHIVIVTFVVILLSYFLSMLLLQKMLTEASRLYNSNASASSFELGTNLRSIYAAE